MDKIDLVRRDVTRRIEQYEEHVLGGKCTTKEEYDALVKVVRDLKSVVEYIDTLIKSEELDD